eukprot:4713268-Pyramimonas_sp.AAC.1
MLYPLYVMCTLSRGLQSVLRPFGRLHLTRLPHRPLRGPPTDPLRTRPPADTLWTPYGPPMDQIPCGPPMDPLRTPFGPPAGGREANRDARAAGWVRRGVLPDHHGRGA